MTRTQAEALDNLAREALRRFKLDAFDTVDVAKLVGDRTLVPERVEWIARHLLRHGRGIEAYRFGQQILGMLRAVDGA